MSAETTHPAAVPQLRRNSLGLPELVFQGITHIAPATNVVFTFPIIAQKAGPDMPISFLLTTIVCFFIANTVSQFSSYMPSSGGYYSFATRGLGSRSGFMATWSYLIYDILGPAASTGFLGFLLSDTLRTEFGFNVPWWLFAMAAFGIIWLLTHYGVEVSVRTTALFGAVEMLIMLALAITFLIHPGPGSSYAALQLKVRAGQNYRPRFRGTATVVRILGPHKRACNDLWINTLDYPQCRLITDGQKRSTSLARFDD